jgi:hypothetical protein
MVPSRFSPRVMIKIQIWVDSSGKQRLTPASKVSLGGAKECLMVTAH